ncbi:MAG: hypothetical protein DMF95_31190 [Acidobacteria bacterium]|nr:MAG: hypothetical protein DMF95_31190 [Acidobacteriota bacterium]
MARFAPPGRTRGTRALCGPPRHPIPPPPTPPSSSQVRLPGLTEATFVQRLNTAGGVAPSTGCSGPTDVGNEAFVPYTADYFFYRA